MGQGMVRQRQLVNKQKKKDCVMHPLGLDMRSIGRMVGQLEIN